VRQGDQFTFVLQAETFAVSSVKVAAPDEKTPRERELARLSSVRDLCEGLDLLYRAFLARRLTGYWEGETKDVRAWLTETRTNRAAA
jgi:hypothetical protein